MRIDTQRLATDPGYWDEVGAPEGATHFCISAGEFIRQCPEDACGACIPRPQEPNAADQEKRILVETFVAGPGRDRIAMGDSERVMRHGDRVEIYLTRAQSPEVEWDKDLPDVGDEKQYYNSEMNEVRECVVIAHRHGCAVVEDQDGQSYEAVPPNNFICTKGQRQRDEVIAAAEHAIESHGGAVASSTHLEWLYDAGMLRKPEGGHEGN